MPTYAYLCENCKEFEIDQKISDLPLEECPKCKAKVKRLISNTSFILGNGGVGWAKESYSK